MKRHQVLPRQGWERLVTDEGLSYAVDRAENGSVLAYWHEQAAYQLHPREVAHLETLTEELHTMFLQAARHLLTRPPLMASLALPPAAAEYVAHSLDAHADDSLYGRFDLVWGGEDTGPAKVLEYNAQTPAGLYEAAVTQWTWLEALYPDRDQFNMLHERLIQGWQRLGRRHGQHLHLAVGQNEPTEDWVTVAYLSETASDAGLTATGITMEDIGWDHATGRFVDVAEDPIRMCFVMYPWEWMFAEAFGEHLFTPHGTTFVEPAWKLLLGSKAVLVALHEIYPDHPSVLPATLGEPGPWTGYVAKPVYGWEGAGIEVVTADFRHAQPVGCTEGQQVVYQQYTPLPRFDGFDVDRAYPVLGTWYVNGHAAGLGIRESSGPVTDTGARFLPHYIDAPRSTPEQVAAWLAMEESARPGDALPAASAQGHPLEACHDAYVVEGRNTHPPQ